MDHRRLIPGWLPAALVFAAVLLIAVLVLRARTVNPASTAGILTSSAGNPASAVAPNTGTGTAKKAPPPAAAPPAAATPRPQVSRGVCPTGPAFARQTLYSADSNAKDSAGGAPDGKPLNGAAYGPGSTGAPQDQAFAFNG